MKTSVSGLGKKVNALESGRGRTCLPRERTGAFSQSAGRSLGAGMGSLRLFSPERTGEPIVRACIRVGEWKPFSHRKRSRRELATSSTRQGSFRDSRNAEHCFPLGTGETLPSVARIMVFNLALQSGKCKEQSLHKVSRNVSWLRSFLSIALPREGGRC